MTIFYTSLSIFNLGIFLGASNFSQYFWRHNEVWCYCSRHHSRRRRTALKSSHHGATSRYSIKCSKWYQSIPLVSFSSRFFLNMPTDFCLVIQKVKPLKVYREKVMKLFVKETHWCLTLSIRMFNMKHEISAGTKVEDAKALMAASSLKIMADDNLDAAAATVSLFIHQNSVVYIHCFSL